MHTIACTVCDQWQTTQIHAVLPKVNIHHQTGNWNAIWSDHFTDSESHFMRYGKAKGGIIGIKLKPEFEALKTWSLSYYRPVAE